MICAASSAPGVLEPLNHPRRREAERLVGRLLDHRAPDVQVCVAHVDVARAGVIRRDGDRARERRLVDESVDEHVLALADVRADADGELCVTLQAFVSHVSKYTASTPSAPAYRNRSAS